MRVPPFEGTTRHLRQIIAMLCMVLGASVVTHGNALGFARTAVPTPISARSLKGPPLTLSKTDAARLALYAANGEPAVVLSIAARIRQNANAVVAVQRHGGRVDYRLDSIDYLTAVLPTSAVAAFLAEPVLEAVAIDNLNNEYAGEVHWFSGTVGPEGEVSQSAASSATAETDKLVRSDIRALRLPARPLESMHSILRDMDGEAFQKRDLRFDGRGVVIAHIEDFPDFLSPELQLAKDATGKDIPKFADVISIPAPAASLDSAEPRRGGRWTTRLSLPIASNGLTLNSGGRAFRLPKPGTYRLAQLELPSTGWGRFVYPHARKAHAGASTLKEGAPLLLDVLWSERERRLWIDSNGNRDFSDEKAVGDYRTSREFGVLGADDPATEIRESAPYAVQADGDYIGINLAYSSHATFVAGAAAASRGKGLVEGVAPGAQLIAIAYGGGGVASIAAFVRGLATAYMNPRVDVVLVQGRSVITDPDSRKDGQSLLAIVQSRLVERYRKATLATSNNNVWISSIMDFTAPQNVISVGASQSAESLFSYYGIKSRHAQDLHWVGAEGPSGDGGLKPDILAPANPVSVINRDQWQAFFSLYPGVFRLPVGYAICGGTSCATPVAAGAAALLVGAAKLHGLPHDANAIHDALRNSASFMSHVPAYKQGRGILQIDAAWRYLNSRAKRNEHYDIEVAAPVRTVWSDTLPRPHTGRGLFEREGWRADERQERVILLTRRSGPKEPVRFDVGWEGNSGAFTSRSSIILPLNQPVALNVGIRVEAPGVYSSIVHLNRPSEPGTAASIPVTIVVPHEFTDVQGFAWEGKVELGRPAGRHNLFFRIPEGTKAFSVRMETLREGVILYLVPPHNPDAGPYSVFTAKESFLSTNMTAGLTVEAPASGVWEVVLHDEQDKRMFDWQAADLDYLPSSEIKISAKILGASAAVEGEEVRLENKLGAFNGAVENLGLGGLRSSRATLRPREPLVVDLEVEAGQALLAAAMDRVGGADLDADLHLFDCTGERCALSRRSDNRGAREQVVVEKPAPGKWKVVILASGDEQGAMELAYTDYYTHPRLGMLTTTDQPQERLPGETWQARMKVWRIDEPREGYRPAGVIRIRDESLRMLQKEAYASSWLSAGRRAAHIELKPFVLGNEATPAVAALPRWAGLEHLQSECAAQGVEQDATICSPNDACSCESVAEAFH